MDLVYDGAGSVLKTGTDFWRFNRIHDYGPMYEDPKGMSLALGGSHLDVEGQDDLLEMSS